MTRHQPSFSLLLVLCILFGGTLVAQTSKTDSLLARARSMPDDTAKMRLLWRVATAIGYNYPDSAYNLLDQAVAIGDHTPYSNEYKSDALHAQAVILQRQGNWQQSERKAKQILSIVRPMNDQNRMAHAYNMLAITNGTIGRFDSAVHYYMLAIDIARPLNDHKVLITSLANLGAIYGYVMKDYPKALASAQEALDLAEKNGYKDSECGLYTILGGLMTEQGDLKTALGYYLSAVRVAQESNNQSALAEANANVAEAYIRKEMPVKAEQYARKALEMNASLKNQYIDISAHITLAKALNTQQKYAEALSFAEKELQCPDPTTRIDAYEAAWEAAKGLGERDKARKYKTAYEALRLELEAQSQVQEDIRRIERQHGIRLFARRK